MFLASDTQQQRELRIRDYPKSDEEISLLLAAVNFEWTVTRAIHFLSKSPTLALRTCIKNCRGPKGYEKLWKKEVVVEEFKPLATIVCDWPGIGEAFDARNRLAHGQLSYTRKKARPHIEVLLKGAGDVYGYCEAVGRPLHCRMRVRR